MTIGLAHQDDLATRPRVDGLQRVGQLDHGPFLALSFLPASLVVWALWASGPAITDKQGPGVGHTAGSGATAPIRCGSLVWACVCARLGV